MIASRKDYKMEGIKNFWNDYKGAIIGVIVAIILIITKFYELILSVILIILGAIAGNYVQQNKDFVKEKIKRFIDRF